MLLLNAASSNPTITSKAGVGGFQWSFRNYLLAGWLLGIVETLVAGFVGLQYRDAVGFVALILMLTVRPHGLFSTRARF